MKALKDRSNLDFPVYRELMVGANQYKGRGELQSGAFFVISKERLSRYRNEVEESLKAFLQQGWYREDLVPF